ncbi:MAG: D-amino acid dehydrogenase [Rhodospirillales bacterium]|nr:D-amino acid dehydrogenase [Xanthobacteraceae bacterium]MCW5698878.1 D-amino acid dehydrogenase [Rhodospirillales bacterium]
MKVAVLGAGVVGVATAYFLARSGHEVIVVDRQAEAGLETSFANGGQISANHATPWATPGTPWKAVKWLGRRDAPLLLHLRADLALWSWCLRFLGNCTNQRMRINTERALRVAVYSRAQLAEVREQTGIQYDQLQRGILHFYRDPEEYGSALPQVDLMNRYGCSRHIVSPKECLEIEPALTAIGDDLVGGIFSPDDESGDAFAFTHELARICHEIGVSFRFDTAIRALVRDGDRITGVDCDGERLRADAYVVAMGSYSPLLLKPLGIRLPVVPAKGYSATLPLTRPEAAPVVSLIDDEFKMVYSRLGNRLRIAGTAEFAGYDLSLDDRRARFILGKALEIFPDCGDAEQAALWTGLRPSTPDGVPVMGRTPISNLFVNTGHGTLGWTMACGAGRLVADVIGGVTPAIPLDGTGIDRFA